MALSYEDGDVPFSFHPLKCGSCGRDLGPCALVLRPNDETGMTIEHVTAFLLCDACVEPYIATVPRPVTDIDWQPRSSLEVPPGEESSR